MTTTTSGAVDPTPRAAWLDTVRHDLAYAARLLRRSPGFAIAAVLSLALGIGATTMIFSVVHAVVIDPFPYRDPDTLMSVNLINQRGQGNWSTYTTDQFVEIAERATVFEAVIASTISDVAVTDTGDPERIRGNVVTFNTFEVMGVPALVGRAPTAADQPTSGAQDEPIAVLGHRYWQNRFGGDSRVIGRQMRLNGELRTIVGVMPPRFMWRGADVYLPTTFRRGQAIEGARTVHLMGRLRSGVTSAQIEANLRPIIEELRQREPERIPENYRIHLESFSETFSSSLRPALLALLAAVGLLLLIACANVSNLLLARASVREREMALRASLGASRGRLMRQLVTESLLLGVAGGLLGILAARASLAGVLALIPPDTIPDESKVVLNMPVLLFALGIALTCVIVFGLAPAWQTSRTDLVGGLRDGGRGTAGGGVRHARTRSLLVAAELALAVVLLVGAGLMMRTLAHLQRIELGFEPARLLTMRVPLADTRYPNAERRGQFFTQLLERVQALPGVRFAAVDSGLPLFGGRGSQVDLPEVSGTERRFVLVHETSASYLTVYGTRLVSGRALEDTDITTARRVATINQAFARRYFGEMNPIGRTVRLLYLSSPPLNQKNDTFEIVGIVRDVRNQSVRRDVWPEVHVPFGVNANPLNLLVVAAVPPLQLERSVRSQVYAIDPEQPVTNVRTFDRTMDEWTFARPRFTLVLLSIFATIGLLLATIGVYGVIAYSVARQTSEIGVRMALGARPGDILRMVLARGVRLVGAGLVVGCVASLLASRFLVDQLWGVSARDPLAYGVVIVVLGGVGLAACLWPAIRAARVSPLSALRTD
jgi:putative ABC transport system permease protein